MIALRSHKFDQVVPRFLEANPRAAVINIGCGLDTRYHRLGCPRVAWVDLDFEEVIALRNELLGLPTGHQRLGGSVLEFSWMERLQELADRPKLIVAEGLLMFLPEEKVRELVLELCRRFPESEMIFDCVSSLEVICSRLHPVVAPTGARFSFGLSRAEDLLAWSPQLRLREEWFYCQQNERRLKLFRALRFLPRWARTARIMHLDLASRNVYATAS
jgi:O-methyltransferase involved in polyketide biosynthesis